MPLPNANLVVLLVTGPQPKPEPLTAKGLLDSQGLVLFIPRRIRIVPVGVLIPDSSVPGDVSQLPSVHL